MTSGGLVDLPEPRLDEWGQIERLFWAHKDATVWGSARFAAELRSRDQQERLARAADLRHAAGNGSGPSAALADVMSGPVAWNVSEHVIDPDAEELDLSRPARHPHVPRPPEGDPSPEAPDHRGLRRARPGRRRPGRTAAATPAPVISEQEAARMSSAGRRLYGLPDLPLRVRL